MALRNVWQGISLTALKRACRSIGIKKWPYLRSPSSARKETADEDRNKTQEAAVGWRSELFAEALQHVEQEMARGRGECVMWDLLQQRSKVHLWKNEQ